MRAAGQQWCNHILQKNVSILIALISLLSFGCASTQTGPGVGEQLTQARAADGNFISWREHIIDDPLTAGVNFSGSDGLEMADLDRDGYEDIVSVHESDVVIGGVEFEDQYSGKPTGHIRIAWGSADPLSWLSQTVAEGENAGGAEDVALADINGDGWIDIVAACELAHLIYLENPGDRNKAWKLIRPSATRDRGSFIRVFAADFNHDARPEIVAVNKGAQNPTGEERRKPNPISVFEIDGQPLQDESWKEHVLTRVAWPINAPPVDLDADGDLDIVASSTGEGRLMWFENTGSASIDFIEHRIDVLVEAGGNQPRIGGFNLAFADFNGDGRLDIVASRQRDTVWLQQPADFSEPWRVHIIGNNIPDSVTGMTLGDIDADGDPDLFTGSYSRGPRDRDGDLPLTSRLGRISWFENPGTIDQAWQRHDISRRIRGMFDAFVAKDMDKDGDLDFVGTRGNSFPYDGVFWLEQERSAEAVQVFRPAREKESREVPLP